MIGTRLRKVLRDITARKARTALVSISIFIGVLGVVTLMGTGELLINQMNEDFRTEDLPMLYIGVNVPANADLDNDAYIEQIESFNGVTDVEANLANPVYWRESDDNPFIEGRVIAPSTAFDEMQLLPMTVFEGRFPESGQNEIALERRMAIEYDLDVGDQLTFRIIQPNTQQQIETWTVTGIVYHAYRGGSNTLYANHADAEYLSNFNGFNSFYVRFEEYSQAESQREALLASLGETPYIVVGSALEDPADNDFVAEIQQWATTVEYLGILAMIVSTFIVFNVVNAIMVEQKRQIGVMKSVGATYTDNLLMYCGVALIYGVIGMLPAAFLGIFTSNQLLVTVAPLANVLADEFVMPWESFLVGIAMGTLIPVVAALIPVIVGSRVTIREAMTDIGLGSNFVRGPVTKILDRMPMPPIIRLALGNIVQRKFRLAVTGFTLTLAVGSFMGVFALFFSLGQIIDEGYDTFQFQIEVEPNQTSDFETVQNLVLSVEGVDDVFSSADAVLQMSDDDPRIAELSEDDYQRIRINGIDTTANQIEFDLLEGDGWLNDNTRSGMVVSEIYADDLGLELGDSVFLTAQNGNIMSMDLIGIDDHPFREIWARWQDLSALVGFRINAPVPNNYAVSVSTEILNNNILALGLTEDLGEVVPLRDGDFFTADTNTVVITDHLAEDADVSVGDSISLVVNDNATAYEVSGIVEAETLTSFGDMLPLDSIEDDRVYIAGLDWQQLATLEGRSADGEIVPQELAVSIKQSDPSVSDVENVIGEIREVLLENGINAYYFNFAASQEEDLNLITTIGLVFNIAALVMASVGAIGLLVTLSMSVFERQREIGVMRSVGASSSVITIQFLIEGLLVGFFAWVAGIPLSIFIKNLLGEVLPLNFNTDFPPVTFAIGFVGIMMVSMIASIGPAILASRKTVSSILRYQ